MLIFSIMNNEEKNYLRQQAKDMAKASLIPTNTLEGIGIDGLSQEMYEILQIQRYIHENAQPAIQKYLFACHGFMILDLPNHSRSKLLSVCKELEKNCKLDTISGEEKEIFIEISICETSGNPWATITWGDRKD